MHQIHSCHAIFAIDNKGELGDNPTQMVHCTIDFVGDAHPLQVSFETYVYLDVKPPGSTGQTCIKSGCFFDL